ncbi:MAG: sigma 54-interacting transcriptional regulator [bacterium]|nr:sigma 54-interacting transcriptional regulator [bacterium]
MTTALIGNRGATAAKACVAIVAAEAGSELANLLAGSGHEHELFADWDALRAAAAQGRDWDMLLYEATQSAEMPSDVERPAVAVGDGADGLTLAALDEAFAALAAMAVELRSEANRRQELEHFVHGLHTGEALAGQCPVVRRLQSSISRAADSDVTVLLEGQVGSGKSLVARMIHCKSRRANVPAIIVDCGDIDGPGMTAKLDEARGTTLLLEDVDQLPAPAQSVLVKHLKERSGPRAQGAARILATTSAHLPEAIARGAFREDLYYRINAFPLVVPALRERVEDIALIAENLLQLAAAQSGRTTNGITPAALVLLESMNWSGNVTQLEAVIRRAHAMSGGAAIDREHVTASSPTQAAPAGSPAAPAVVERDLDREIGEEEIRPFEEEEQYLLSRALRATKGNVRRAAQLLGIGRATLYRKIQQYKLRLQ